MDELLEKLIEDGDTLIDEINVGKGLKTAAAAGLIGGAAYLANVNKPTSTPVEQPVKQVKKVDTSTQISNGEAEVPRGVEVSIDMDRIVQIESSGDPRAVNRKSGARGLCQIIEPTWEECVKRMGENWSWDEAFDPDKNLAVGSFYMNTRIPQMLSYFDIPDTIETRIGCYDWGINYVLKGYRKYGNDWVNYAPEETQEYIEKYES